MNPFYLSGPSFLSVYIIVGILVLVGLYMWIDLANQENIGIPGVMNDPYKIAYLRGGDLGAIEVAVFSLVDRKLLLSEENSVQSKKLVSTDVVNRPIEKALLDFFNYSRPWREALSNAAILSVCDKYKKELQAQGLIKNEQILKKQNLITVFVAIGFIASSILKIFIAISNGHNNVLFLLMLTFLFVFLTILIGSQRLTLLGKKEFENLKYMFANLNRRAYRLISGGQTNEAALLAAVYGLKSIPEDSFPFVKYFKPKPSAGSSCSAGCGGGSSCSGGSCGGGGGCGGCSG